jgi:DNA-directed RNA polymerase I subunit RPA43
MAFWSSPSLGIDSCQYCLRTQPFCRLTVANEMVSLQGSIQIDPFSLEHASAKERTLDALVSEDEILSRVVEQPAIVISNDGEDSDHDRFQHLSKKRKDAASRVAKRKVKEADVAKHKKKKQKGDEKVPKDKSRRKKA